MPSDLELTNVRCLRCPTCGSAKVKPSWVSTFFHTCWNCGRDFPTARGEESFLTFGELNQPEPTLHSISQQYPGEVYDQGGMNSAVGFACRNAQNLVDWSDTPYSVAWSAMPAVELHKSRSGRQIGRP